MDLINTNRIGISTRRGLKMFFTAVYLLLLLSAGKVFANPLPVDFSAFTELVSTDGKYGDFRFKISWNPDMGYSLILADSEKKNQCFIQLRKNNGGINFKGIWTLINQELAVKNINPLPDKPTAELECILKLHQHSWSIYLGNREIYRIRPPFTADSLWLQNQALDVKAKTIRFQKTESLYFHDDFLIADKDENQLDNWEILSGKWHIHTALDAAVEQKSSVNLKTRPLETERSPNFYSLKGSGENSLIVSGYHFHDNYLLQAAIQIQKGESGLAFYVEDEFNYYTFSIYLSDDEESFAFLKKHQSGKQPVIMKTVQLKLLNEQWIMPKVQVTNDHIAAYIDNIKIMDLDEPLPSGGQFGLFVNSSQTMIFDDVTAESLPYLKLDDAADVKFNMLLSHGNVFYRPGSFDWLIGKWRDKDLFSGGSEEDRWLVFGHPEDKIAVTGMSVKLKSDNANAGLIFGWKDQKSPFFRFLYTQNNSKCNVRLEQLKTDGAEPKVLETADFPADEKSMCVHLKAELAPDGLIKLFCNDKLVMVKRESAAPEGAAGVFVGKNSDLSVSNLVYRFKPEEVFRDKLEKNEIFSNDPFMRHWASPAGEWIKDDKEQGYWHKSDFFSSFSLTVPIVENSEIHLGAKDGQPLGEVIVRISGSNFEITECPSGKSLLKKPLGDLFKKDKEGKDAAKYELSLEDTWLWGNCNGSMVFKINLKQALAGSRIFIKGFADAQLGLLHAVRDKVLDFLFIEAPYEWTQNGGTWQVINRFQCDPRWSHMNGESVNDLASLWSKYQLEGDFCIEMFAGTRHGDWYQRVGDLNLTVMNQGVIPSDGYTFICGGWDPDYSQTKSLFFRNGKLIADSDKYLTPRLRDGNVRKYFDPLNEKGRDVHGAWYYIKVRRIGGLIEYYFDNEKIFSFQDEQPIEKGGFGIWTFMNSMMVARVKVAAGKITPKVFPFAEADAVRTSVKEVKISEKPALLLNGLPANLTTPDSWQQVDSAGAPRATFSQNGIMVINTLGAGKFAIEAKSLEYPNNSISAWTCELKRTENARFNFHFELGSRTPTGEYKTLQNYFYQISGTDYSKGVFQLAGTTGEIKPVKLRQLDSGGNWIRVWFPIPSISPKFSTSKDLVWKIIGFGNYQPDNIVQGFNGNGPGEAYAIRNFCPVFYQVPNVECKSPPQADYSYELLLDEMSLSSGSLEEFNKKLKSIVLPGLVSGRLSITGKSDQTDLMWAMPEDESRWQCRWDNEKLNSVIITTDANYRYLTNDKLTVKVKGVELPVEELGINKFRISLIDKMDENFRKLLQDDILNLEILKGNKSRYIRLSWEDCTAVAPPILAKLEGITPFFQSFENTELRSKTILDLDRMKLTWDKERSSTCLTVANKLANQRLRTEFNANLSIAQYPLIQFIYKTDPIGQISLSFRDNAVAHLNEPHMSDRKVRFGTELEKDGKWHSWTGLAADAFEKNTYTPSIYKIPKFAIGSFNKEDQTGRNSQLSLDDVVCGPAVRQAEQLAFTPYYYDRKDGIKVYTVIIPGEKPYFSLDMVTKKKIVWAEIKNNVKHIPDLGTAAEGVYQILLKAVSQDGLESQVTSIPLLYDKTSETASFAFKTTDEPTYNGSYLQIVWQNKNGAPLNHELVTSAFAGAKIPIDRNLSRMEHRQNAEIIEINWPYMLRTRIDKMKDGESGELLVSGLEDGAGNKTADLHIPIKMNYAGDKLPPTCLKSSLPENVLFRMDPVWAPNVPLPFKTKDVKNKILKEDSSVFGRFTGTSGGGTLTLIPKKRKSGTDIEIESYLTMRLRFPHPEIPKSASLTLGVKYSDDKTVQVNLVDGKITANGKIENFLDVKNNKWQDFTIDLKELFIRKFGENDYKQNLQIKEISLIAKDLNATAMFDLSFMTVYLDFKPDDKFELDAYDQSGIGVLTWMLTDVSGKPINNGTCESRAFVLNQMEPVDGLHWLALSLEDKVGNRTLPMITPIILKKVEPK